MHLSREKSNWFQNSLSKCNFAPLQLGLDELREVLGADWLLRQEALVERHVDAYVAAAWGKALDAMSPGGGDPGGAAHVESS